MIRIASALAALSLAACSQADGTSNDTTDGNSAPPSGATASAPVNESEAEVFSRIAPDEIVRFTGTEPFWGGQVAFTTLTYSTPEDPDGTAIEVQRMAGRGGVSWSGQYEGAPFTLAVTPGKCSDGMSDRTYPYVATLQVQGEQRNGCAWTERDPFTAPPGYEADDTTNAKTG